GELPGGEAGANASQAEAGALLVAEVDDAERPGGPGAPVAECVQGGEGGHHAEGAVEGAAVGHGVQVRAGDDGVPGGRVAEPGPLVAVAVGLVGQAAGAGLLLEPGPAVGVGRGPGVAAVAAGAGVAADGQQLRPHAVEAHARSPSRMGMRTPRLSATDSAMSYPASTCRITPMPGSLGSTRRIFSPASAVPSATVTCPAWRERPMPTPPPWCRDTQEAPDATLTMALSSGQSAMASEPSRMASVSRYGEATEPQSRWSRPMTTGAESSPLATMSLNRSPARSRSP